MSDRVEQTSQAARADAVRAVIDDVLGRRAAGEILTDEAVLAAHSDLLPELEDELRAATEMHKIFLAARKAGAATGEDDLIVVDDSVARARKISADRAVAIEGYSILHEINTGGQGTVFRAKQDATGRDVAIKVIPGGLLTGSRQRARFDREAEILAKLDHPNVVPILDRGRAADGSLFLVMPYIRGKTLDELFDGQQTSSDFDLQEVLELFIGIARGVSEAHRRGIIHRDLKPANVRIDLHGNPHVLDFGLARATSTDPRERQRSITMTGQIVGSLPWTSPEQVADDRQTVDARTDVYALGVMLYQAFTGSFPYNVYGSVREVLNNIAKAIATPPSQTKKGHERGIDSFLDDVVMRALAKSPDDRYPGAAELADDLQEYIDTVLLARPRKRQFKFFIPKQTKWVVLAICVALVVLSAWKFWPEDDEVVRLPRYRNSIGMEFAKIPSGKFVMGSARSDMERGPAEWVNKRTTIQRDFYLGITEVTQKQYREVMGELPKTDPLAEGDDYPVTSVSLVKAIEFCDRLSEKESRHYRLPKDDEWEYACRGGLASRTFGGIDLASMGWFKGNSDARVHRVAKKQPNRWGLFDMHGNVSEWCDEKVRLPAFPEMELGRKSNLTFENYVTRGGNAMSSEPECRSAARAGADPRYGGLYSGFRVVLELASSKLQ